MVFSLGPGGVEQIIVDLSELGNALGNFIGTGIVRHNNPVAINRILKRASSFDSVPDGVKVFASAGNQDVNVW